MRTVTIKKFKIRASAACQIMGGTIGLTSAQMRDKADLMQKRSDKGSLTVKQSEKLQSLLDKENNPALPQGAKTYCELWLKEQLYERRKEFTSKYTQKGNDCEDDAIGYVSKVFGWGEIYKNTKRKENEYMTGEADLVLFESVEDIKNCFDFSTFPLFDSELDDKANEYQIQVYMELYNKPIGGIIKVLSDSPESLIDRECNIFAANNDGMLTEGDYNRIKSNHTYSHLPDHLRVKRFEFKRDPNFIKDLIKRVEMCRFYIESLLDKVYDSYEIV